MSNYVVKQSKVFRLTNERPDGAPMKGMLAALTNKDIEAVSAYVQAITNQQEGYCASFGGGTDGNKIGLSEERP